MSPIATGRMVTLPYYPGYKYVAFAAKDTKEVYNINIFTFFDLHLKAGTFTIYNERPDKLVYHDRCFHVLDMKVCNIVLLYLINLVSIFSVMSVP